MITMTVSLVLVNQKGYIAVVKNIYNNHKFISSICKRIKKCSSCEEQKWQL